MQIAETLNDGLKRSYTLTIPAQDIDARVQAEVKKAAPQVRMPGFRPGKVPANLILKMHGPALRQDALNTAVQEGVQKLLTDKALRPAMQPAVALADGYEHGRDAELTVEMEVLPDVPTPVIDGLTIERLTVAADDAAVDAQVQQFASQQKNFTDAPDGHAAQTGDLVVMDFAGKVDGKAFDGGTGTDMSVEIGAGRMIPGFEDGVIGAKAGDTRTIDVTFPDDYGVATLKGKPATFDLTIKAVRIAGETTVDDDFAKSLGLESLDQLRGLIKGQIEQEHNGLTRTYMKRRLLDQLAEKHDFAVPPSMVEAEFQQIWAQLEHEASHQADADAAKAEMEAERDDYRRIAERRVRLGLLLSEIGQQNGIEVSQQEMQRLVMQAAQQYPEGQRQRFFDYVQSEPMAAAQLRAPLYEDKVVDFLFGKATVTEREVTKDELEAAIEADADAEHGHVHGPGCGHDHSHEEPAKQAKKARAAKADAPASDAEPAPVKKATKKAATDDAPATDAPADEAEKPKRAKKAATDEATAPKKRAPKKDA